MMAKRARPTSIRSQGVDSLDNLLNRPPPPDYRSTAVFTNHINPDTTATLPEPCVFDLDSRLDLDIGAYADDASDRAALVAIAQQRAGDRYGSSFGRTNTIVIGDTTQDIAAARDSGAGVIAVASGSDTADRLCAAGADQLLPDLTDSNSLIEVINRWKG
jgi:phosphoglycolate phosphatase-like HAD superfamily hydrolase